MNKSTKLVSLFLSTALVLGTTGCGTDQQVVYDENGDQVIQNSGGGFFSHIYRPFGFSSSNHVSSGATRSLGTSGASSGSSSGSKSSSVGTGISSGSHGGIGGGGSSAS